MVIAVWGCIAACGGAAVSTGVLPAPSAPPAARLLAQASSPTDAHITYQTHFGAEGPLAAGSRYVKKLWSGAGEIVLKPKLMASLRETDTFCYDLCPLNDVIDGKGVIRLQHIGDIRPGAPSCPRVSARRREAELSA